MASRSASLQLPVVLIVDNDPLVCAFFRDALEPTVRVIAAQDGDRALAIIEARRTAAVDLVLIDDVLPRCPGLHVLRTVKLKWPWIPAVFVTARGSPELAVQAIGAGANAYLAKPIPLDTLRQTVGSLLSGSAEGTRPRHGHPNVRRGIAFILNHFADRISLDDVARAAGLSRFHFSRLFRGETGLTVLAYVHCVRVEQAKRLLSDPYARLSEVAYETGFSDLAHFDRTFRKVTGRSPTQYRSSAAPEHSPELH